MANAQRGQAVKRAQFNMPYMQNLRYIQPMPVYQQFPQMGYTPFNPGFGFTNYRVVRLPVTPPLPYQPYVQQPRPIASPVYPSAPVMIPPPPVYTAQPLYRAQGNQNNNNPGRPIVYVQPNIPQQPVNYNNVQVLNPNNAPRNTFQNPQTPVIQLNPQFSNQMNMNYNINMANMPPGFVNRGNNRGWWIPDLFFIFLFAIYDIIGQTTIRFCSAGSTCLRISRVEAHHWDSHIF